MCVGGEGVARGYLNKPDLTAERFVPHAFSSEGGRRLYRTGDLGRYLPDGRIEYLGRADQQVKIRGFRIEPGEIETWLRAHPSIRDAAVEAREEESGEKRLVAYLVDDFSNELPVEELRSYLREKLPEYMIPSAFVWLKALPLTPNGKLDRKALPKPDQSRPELRQGYVAPGSPVEQLLATIWAEALGIEKVGVHDNFFELGGDSILSIQMTSHANQAGVGIVPRQLFQHQTIAELAAVVQASSRFDHDQELVAGQSPLTPIQHWLFQQKLAEPHHFNQAVLLEANLEIDPELLGQAFSLLLIHHDALRSRFESGSAFQTILDSEPHRVFSVIDLSNLRDQRSVLLSAATRLQASLDLSTGPLLRAALFLRGSVLPGRLLIVVHHLAVDGVSWRVLLEDLQSLYLQLLSGEISSLPPKTSSYKRWAEALTEYAHSGDLLDEASYWETVCSGEFKPLPIDHDQGANTTASVRTVNGALTREETTALLQEAPEVYHTQINDLLLTALALTLSEWAETDTVLIDLEGHGREEVFENLDVSRTIGWFTTIFPVRLRLERGGEAGEAIKSVKEQLRRIPNKGFGYGALRHLASEEIAGWLAGMAEP